MWKTSKAPSKQTVGGGVPLLIYAIWAAKAERQISNRTGFSCASLSGSVYLTDVAGLYLSRFDLFGCADGFYSHTSNVKYRVTFLWALLILFPFNNILHCVDSGQWSPMRGRCSGQIGIWLFTVKILAKCMLDSACGRGVCWLFPSLAWRSPTLEQPFTADVFCSGRQDICLKRNNHDNASKSSN